MAIRNFPFGVSTIPLTLKPAVYWSGVPSNESQGSRALGGSLIRERVGRKESVAYPSASTPCKTRFPPSTHEAFAPA